MQSVIHEKMTSVNITVITSADTNFNQVSNIPGEYIQFSAHKTNTSNALLATASNATDGRTLVPGEVTDMYPIGNANLYYWKAGTSGDKLTVHALRR